MSAALPFVRGPVPASLSRRTVTIEPGERLAYASDAWRDALVVVDKGEIDLEDRSGQRWRLEQGAVLWLCRLPLRQLVNPGWCPARLVAVRRR